MMQGIIIYNYMKLYSFNDPKSIQIFFAILIYVNSCDDIIANDKMFEYLNANDPLMDN